ncbi:NADH-quinone oxidoreductase subunit NuoH [Clostridium pasteurianum]|uniref:NADH-quinone oxidoreductase subunit H n=1 Tax=Clostridium pasteurianum BC1 TaxID=86416 RepID=R4KB93_CLOPA|nr:NADH-quinone oxidoreductase subunit NuoH [Clostridium pasteurianum]AGK96900.1 NADH:ubiquinone oxidoreductase subunit 1 (chain H) [Clostridium pasteurianum BC1]
MENIFINISNWTEKLILALGIPHILVSIIMSIIYFIAIVAFVLLNAMYLIYLERKFCGFLQQRLGPNRFGPRGILQSLADVVKLLGKEDIIPDKADRWVFRLASLLVMVPALLVYAVLPFGENMIAANLNLGVIYFIAISGTASVPILMAGWGSNNKYSLLGGMRVVAQMISYEIPMIFSLLGIVMLSGSLNLAEIISAQHNVWFIFLQPIAFVVYFIAATAELNRGPFDLPEGEQEIIAGPFTEYSGMRYALFYLAEYTNMFAISALIVTLFLGGASGPILPSWIWFILKTYVIILLFMLVRWTFPRFRLDHMMSLNWKYLIPISLMNVLFTGIGVKIFQLIKG